MISKSIYLKQLNHLKGKLTNINKHIFPSVTTDCFCPVCLSIAKVSKYNSFILFYMVTPKKDFGLSKDSLYNDDQEFYKE